jgi:hypothetical protein
LKDRLRQTQRPSRPARLDGKDAQGNKSAIEWVLDQYVAPFYSTDEEVASVKRKIREDAKALRDKFIAFNVADYRQQVVGMIRRLTTASLRMLEIRV